MRLCGRGSLMAAWLMQRLTESQSFWGAVRSLLYIKGEEWRV